MAALESLVVPGWGEIASGENRGWILVGLDAAMAGLAAAGYVTKQGGLSDTGFAALTVLSVFAPVDSYFLASGSRSWLAPPGPTSITPQDVGLPQDSSQ